MPLLLPLLSLPAWTPATPATPLQPYTKLSAGAPLLQVTCTGYELDIHSCYRGTLPPTVAPTTTKADTVGVICDAPPVRLRLMGAAAGVPAGRLEIQADGKTWGTVRLLLFHCCLLGTV